MPYLSTGSTELKAVNQILASVGQAPVTTLTTEETLIVSEVARFTGSISGTTLTTQTANIPVGTYIGGTGVTTGTSIAVAGVEATPATDPVTYEYTLNISLIKTNGFSRLHQNKDNMHLLLFLVKPPFSTPFSNAF